MPSQNETLYRALSLAIVDDICAEQGLSVGPERWGAYTDGERMRRIGEARAARAILLRVVRLALFDLRPTPADLARKELARGPGIVSVEGGRVVTAETRRRRDSDPDPGSGPPHLVVLP